MRNIIRKICRILPLLLLCLFCIPGTAQAGGGFVTTNEWDNVYLSDPEDIGITGMYRDDFVPGNYNIFITTDRQRRTETYYQTRGFTMQRCVPGSFVRDEEHPQYITIKANQANNSGGQHEADGDEGCYYEVWRVGENGQALPGEPAPGEKIYTVWYISADTVEKKIKEVSDLEDPESWYNVITTVPGYHYLKVDSLMTYYDNGVQMGDLWKRSDTEYMADRKLYGIPEEIPDMGLLDYHDMPFGFGSKLESHYNGKIQLPYVPEGDPEPEPEPPTDEAESSYEEDFVRQYNTYSHIPASGATEGLTNLAPYFKTYNESRAYTDSQGREHTNYDISKNGGIPTKEKLVNGIEVDGFYGYVDIGKHTVTNTKWGASGEDTFTVPYSYTKKVPRKNPKPGQSKTTTVTYTGTWSGKVSRTAEYYYIWDMDLYDFDRATTENETFPGGRTNYASTGIHQKTDGTMTAARPVYDAVINGKRCGDFGKITIQSWKPDNDEHITWKTCSMTRGTLTGSSKSDCCSKARSWAEKQVGDSGYAVVNNDYLRIGNFTVLDNKTVTVSKSGNYLIEPKWMSDFEREIHETSARFFNPDAEEDGTHMLTIPSNIANGLYYTAFDNSLTDEPDGVIYKKVFLTNGHETVSFSHDASEEPERIERRIRSGLIGNEPVLVHTPVIAPVKIYDGEGNELTEEKQATQLKTENNKVQYQLRLDEDYTFKFEPAKHLEIQGYRDSTTMDNAWEETNNKYDKYVKAKYVHFPFTIRMQDEYIEPVTDPDDPGYWIQLEDLEETQVYIPSWAVEGLYGTGIADAESAGILYKVVSVNVVDQDGNDYDDGDHEQDTANTDRITDGKATYIAVYEIPVQVSGWIYDFQIVGINDRDTYEGHSNKFNDIWYPFCPTKQEKKGGIKNRLGGDSVRYTVDGTITDHWDPKDTVALSNGTSHVYNEMGTAIQGTRFAYTLRTIANLNKPGDSITIRPTYRYIAPDGTEKKDIDIYYTDDSGKETEYYIKGYSSDPLEILDRDKANVQSTVLSSEKYKGSYYKADAQYTAQKAGITLNALLNKKVNCYTMSSLWLGSDLRLLTGNLEQLKCNMDRNPSEVYGLDEFGAIDDYDVTEDAFRSSMQEWFGEYYIPSRLFVTEHHDDVNGEDYIHWYAGQKGGIATDDEIWIKDGYLVLNFEITGNNTDKPQVKNLGYGAQDGDQWNIQHYKTPVKTGDRVIGTEITIPTIPGDVVIIELGKSVSDKYTGQIFMIN